MELLPLYVMFAGVALIALFFSLPTIMHNFKNKSK